MILASSSKPAPSVEDNCRLYGTLAGAPAIGALRAIVVGAGALGNEVCRLLGQLRVREVCVIDGDVVEGCNLPLSVLLRRSATGFKSVALTGFAAEMFPAVRWRAIPKWFSQVGWDRLRNADLIFSCVDNDSARIEVATASVALNRPVMDAGLAEDGSLRGSLAWYPGSGAACAACLFSPARFRSALRSAFEAGPSCSRAVPHGPPAGNPLAASLVAAWQVHLGLQNWLARHPRASVWRLDLDGPYRVDTAEAAQRADCPLHRDTHERIPGPALETFRSWLERSARVDCEVLLDWPVVLRAVCRACGLSFEPRVPLAVLASRVACPTCRARQFAPLEILRSVDFGSAAAGLTPAQLGLPEDHLFRVGKRGVGLTPWQ